MSRALAGSMARARNFGPRAIKRTNDDAAKLTALSQSLPLRLARDSEAWPQRSRRRLTHQSLCGSLARAGKLLGRQVLELVASLRIDAGAKGTTTIDLSDAARKLQPAN